MNVYRALIGNAFAQLAGLAEFALTAAACVVTYTGAGGTYLVRVIATAVSPQGFGFGLGVSKNADLNGDAYPARAEGGTTIDPVASMTACLVSERVVTLANGDTFQPMACAEGSTADAELISLTMTAQRIG